jgi:hypothetical protein
VFTEARNRSLTWVRLINPHPLNLFLGSILLLFSHLHVRLPALFFLLFFLIKTCTHFCYLAYYIPRRPFSQDWNLRGSKLCTYLHGMWRQRKIFPFSNVFLGLRPLACWDCGFESHRRHGCLSVVSVVCCQLEVSASGWSLVQRSITDCGVSIWVCSWILDIEETLPHWGLLHLGKLKISLYGAVRN